MSYSIRIAFPTNCLFPEISLVAVRIDSWTSGEFRGQYVVTQELDNFGTRAESINDRSHTRNQFRLCATC